MTRRCLKRTHIVISYFDFDKNEKYENLEGKEREGRGVVLSLFSFTKNKSKAVRRQRVGPVYRFILRIQV